ncbi:hypothetical protein IGJ63_002065 [Enterococcus sp. DIV1375a]
MLEQSDNLLKVTVKNVKKIQYVERIMKLK